MSDETEALRAEVAELRAEVESLRAWRDSHICIPAQPVTAQCTCGTSALCPVHAPPPWQGTWVSSIQPATNVCAGGATTYAYTVPWSSTATNTVTVGPLHGTAGAAPMPQIITYGAGGECA